MSLFAYSHLDDANHNMYKQVSFACSLYRSNVPIVILSHEHVYNRK